MWDSLDVANEEDLDALYNFLKNNYVEGSDSYFRLKYSKDFLRYALLVPG
jgi:glycylpeptide N-tetradecanoyltransferase